MGPVIKRFRFASAFEKLSRRAIETGMEASSWHFQTVDNRLISFETGSRLLARCLVAVA